MVKHQQLWQKEQFKIDMPRIRGFNSHNMHEFSTKKGRKKRKEWRAENIFMCTVDQDIILQ